jgi:hypothetical protein
VIGGIAMKVACCCAGLMMTKTISRIKIAVTQEMVSKISIGVFLGRNGRFNRNFNRR